jgi:hypothetical protein
MRSEFKAIATKIGVLFLTASHHQLEEDRMKEQSELQSVYVAMLVIHTGLVFILFFVFVSRRMESISMQQETCFVLVLSYRVAAQHKTIHNQNTQNSIKTPNFVRFLVTVQKFLFKIQDLAHIFNGYDCFWW